MAISSGVEEVASGASDAPASIRISTTSTCPSRMTIFSGVGEFTSSASSDAPASRRQRLDHLHIPTAYGIL